MQRSSSHNDNRYSKKILFGYHVPGYRDYIARRCEMTIYNLYIFDRFGTCLFYQEWNRYKQSGMSKDEEYKLMYGLIFSIKSFISRISPMDFKDGFLNYSTNCYRLHFFETPSGLKFILNTGLNVGPMREVLQHLYSGIYVDLIVRNPLCSLNKPIESLLFKTKLDAYIRGLPAFTVDEGTQH